MQRYVIIVEYDGTAYYGWQLQPGLPSVVGQLQASFARTFRHTITIVGASRTDAGVHACGQVASFVTDLVITPEKMMRGWNDALPSDIVVRAVRPVALEHSIFDNIVRKTYQYHIFLSRPAPLYQRYGWYYKGTIDQDMLKRVLQHLAGTHDFTSLCAADAPDPNKIRTIQSITVEYMPVWNAVKVEITAERFLRYMIRRMVGAAVKIASCGQFSVDYIQEVIRQKNPNNPLPTAPAQGLLLYSIEYQKEDSHEKNIS
jgi:tRNA pseudouridine38-40 synthase